jgi:SPP1 gp7 family putative phage head morphogenesis protein
MPFDPPNRIETEYRRLIQKLIGKFLPDDLTPDSVLQAFANLSRTPEVLESLAASIARRMVTQIKVVNARSWREAAREASRGREIFEALQKEMETGVGQRVHELVAENAKLISSIPATIRQEVNNEISRLQLEGLRPETIADYLRKKVPQITKARAALIARTETSKASTALTRARAEDLGLQWGQWITAKDQRVRPSHKNLDGALMRFDDPPQPEALIGQPSTLGRGLAGEFPNCRCNFLPLISLDIIAWPTKCFTGGRILRVTRGQFIKLSGFQKLAA